MNLLARYLHDFNRDSLIHCTCPACQWLNANRLSLAVIVTCVAGLTAWAGWPFTWGVALGRAPWWAW